MQNLMMRLKSRMTSTTKAVIECQNCKDIGWIKHTDGSYESVEPCKCTIKKQHQAIIANSGIAEGFQNKSLDGFKTEGRPEVIKKAKEAAINYINEYRSIRKERNNSIAFVGSVGSGKTHLSIAVANELLERGVPVRYMEYRREIDAIKRNRLDDEYYYRIIMRFKTVEVLLIDDLFKGAVKEGQLNLSDLGIMFDIINHRYLEGKPIIISSEYNMKQLINMDEATGSRILEMCRGRVMDISGKGTNYRIRGI